MKQLGVLATLAALAMMVVGCPSPEKGTASFTTIFTADSGAKSMDSETGLKQGGVPEEDIEAFLVTLERIVLVPADAEDEEDAEEEDAEDEEEDSEETEKDSHVSPEHVVVYEGEMQLNLVDLMGIGEVVSTTEIPAGEYSQIRLSISDPELYLTGSDEAETDIHLTANSRLFVTEHFEVAEGEEAVLMLDFGGMHLVQRGNGGYVLTPQLEAEILIEPAPVLLTGTILSVDYNTDAFVLVITDGNGEKTVHYGQAAIMLQDEAPGDETALQEGVVVDLEGIVNPDGTVAATVIQIL
jgi:predicted  nucleic acid-binding Zn-ribbon protein